ncbi:hypothetical protein ACH5RR_021386 [Cinchona calisaya]|uniref:F-box associated domain-containing protein n=1 Tax=Cinchona calisaya TaxID=153742 RepID=A0ABD2ZK06_9GENT
MWVLEDYNSGRWYLQHSIRNEDIVADFNLHPCMVTAIPISFCPRDADIVYMGWTNRLLSYNIKTRRLEALGVPNNTREIFEMTGEPCWPASCLSSKSHFGPSTFHLPYHR